MSIADHSLTLRRTVHPLAPRAASEDVPSPWGVAGCGAEVRPVVRTGCLLLSSLLSSQASCATGFQVKPSLWPLRPFLATEINLSPVQPRCKPREHFSLLRLCYGSNRFEYLTMFFRDAPTYAHTHAPHPESDLTERGFDLRFVAASKEPEFLNSLRIN